MREKILQSAILFILFKEKIGEKQPKSLVALYVFTFIPAKLYWVIQFQFIYYIVLLKMQNLFEIYVFYSKYISFRINSVEINKFTIFVNI